MIGPKTQTWRMLRSCSLSSLLNSVQRLQIKSILYKPIRGHGDDLGFPTGQKKPHKLGKERWGLVSCQVSLNSVQRLQSRSHKYLGQSEARAAILVFLSSWKAQIWQRMFRSCFLPSFVEFRSTVAREEVENGSANQRPLRPSWFSDRSLEHKLGRGRWDLAFR